MIRLIAVAFALAVASSAQAMLPIAAQQPEEMIINVRERCGAGMHRVKVGASELPLAVLPAVPCAGARPA